MWTPISLDKLYDKIFSTEESLLGEMNNLWDIIKIEPAKWRKKGFNESDASFWVVAVYGQNAIWYCDIDNEFNISPYKIFGELSEETFLGGDNLDNAIQVVYNQIKNN
jgi:hypothetical protein